MMKKYFLAALMGCVLLLAPKVCFADEVPLYINGDSIQVNESDGKPYINTDNRTMIPLRVVNQYLGYATDWTEDGVIHIYNEDKSLDVSLSVNQKKYMHNGAEKTLTSTPVIKNNRTYIPARDIAELYGAIQWNDGKVYIYPEKNYNISYQIDNNG